MRIVHVLIVEDDEACFDVLLDALEHPAWTFARTWARTLADVERLLQPDAGFDVVITDMDLGMGGGGKLAGLEVIALTQRLHLPCILHSGSQPGDFDLHGFPYLPKGLLSGMGVWGIIQDACRKTPTNWKPVSRLRLGQSKGHWALSVWTYGGLSGMLTLRSRAEGCWLISMLEGPETFIEPVADVEPTRQWVIELRSGGFLQSSDAESSGPLATAQRFPSLREAEDFMALHTWTLFNGGMAVRRPSQ